MPIDTRLKATKQRNSFRLLRANDLFRGTGGLVLTVN